MITSNTHDEAFEAFTKNVAILAEAVNDARRAMKGKMGDSQIETNGTTRSGDGRTIRDYEIALEELKGYVQNRSLGHVHNDNLKVTIGVQRYAIRALEVELVHPVVQKAGDEKGMNHQNQEIDEELITGVVVRGLISLHPADGNETPPNYSSKSSSSSVPPPTTA